MIILSGRSGPGRRWRWLRGSRTRTAVLTAALAILILVPLAGLGHAAAAGWQDAQTRATGEQQTVVLMRALQSGGEIRYVPHSLPWEISVGSYVVASSPELRMFEASGPIIIGHPLVPDTAGAVTPGPTVTVKSFGPNVTGPVTEVNGFTNVPVTLPSPGGVTTSSPSTSLPGTHLDVLSQAVELTTLPAGQFAAFGALPADTLVRVSVFLTPFATRLLVHRVDIGLMIGLPLLVGLAALCAGIAVGRSMRSVERLRRQTVAATAPGSTALVVSDTDDELSAMAGAINDNVQRLRDSLAAQRQFVADAAHELRNPLSVLISGLEIADRYPDRARWPEVSAQALRSARRLQGLTQDLLTLAQLDADAPARTEPVSLPELCADLIAARQPAGGAVRLTLEDCPDATVRGDRARLARAIGNLLDNGIRHARTAVTVRIGTENGLAIVDVHNDGPAIAVADRERIFDRFTRLDEARARDDGGAGLGLAIARDAARRHGGTVSVCPTESGATFRVTLPGTETPAPHRAANDRLTAAA